MFAVKGTVQRVVKVAPCKGRSTKTVFVWLCLWGNFSLDFLNLCKDFGFLLLILIHQHVKVEE